MDKKGEVCNKKCPFDILKKKESPFPF